MENSKIIKKFNIMAIILIIIFCIVISPITLQNDTYYTISVGKHILENGVDMQDTFSWHNLPYTYPHWAYDVFIYLIYAAFGMTGIYISTCGLSAILGLTLYFTNCKIAKNHLFSFIITLISMYLIKDYIAARAQLLTFILFVLAVYFIEQFLATKKKRYVAGLIIIPIIIANFHAAVWMFYFILFLPYIGEYIIAIISDAIMSKRGEKSKEKRRLAKENPYKLRITRNDSTKWLIVIMLVCMLTGILTPQTSHEPYTHIFKLMSGNTTQNINEHQPLAPIKSEEILCLIIGYLAILTFTKTKIDLKDLFMIGGLAFLMLYSKRQSTMFVLIGAFIINKMLLETLENYYGKGAELKLLKEVTKKFGIFAITAFVIGVSLHFISEKEGNTFVDETVYPVAACDYILENIDVQNSKFYNDYNYGSYMLFRGIPVFIDSRADLYSPEFNTPTGNPDDGKDIFMDFIEASGIAKYYDSVFDDYNMTHVITTSNSKISMLINHRGDNKYKEIYKDKYFVIYEIQRTK